MLLNELKIKECGKILKVNGGGKVKGHLIDMGIIPGANIKIVNFAPMGDPIEVFVHGYNLTLRIEDAKNIEVEKIHEGLNLVSSCKDCSLCGKCDVSKTNIKKVEVCHPGFGELGKFHDHSDKIKITENETLTFALVGNPNTGKTTLFNALTGSNQHVGNFPGVTVDKKSGQILKYKNTLITDLPGAYSLIPYSSEEKVTRDFLINEKPHCIINIVDANTIERNLYLTLQVLELNIPTVLAINMFDELTENGGTINVNHMEAHLGIPVIPISAINGDGIDELVRHAVHIARYQEKPKVINFYKNELDSVEAITNARYKFIDELCSASVTKPLVNKGLEASNKIDKLLTGRFTGIPIFLLIMCAIFFLTFNLIGPKLQDLISIPIDYIIKNTSEAFIGVGTVISFIPIILVLFFFLSILEDSGYLARVAFIMDKFLRKLGISGRSAVPMIIGFGCTVPAVMATRTIPSDRDRKITILLLPFITCSAKLPVYSFLANAFFPGRAGLIVTITYIFSMIIGLIFIIIINLFSGKKKAVPFVMELPPYRLPSLMNVFKLLWEKAKDFLTKAFTIIFVASLIIWLLRDNMTAIGEFIAPIFKPIGLNDSRIIISLITGFLAKESVVANLSTLYGSMNNFANTLTINAALSLLVFTSLYTPCVAAVAAIKKELGAKWALFIALWQSVIAYVLAFIIYNLV